MVNWRAESHETVESCDEKSGAGTNRRRIIILAGA
jgi:hypothetical protein